MGRLRFLHRLLGQGRRYQGDHDQKNPNAAILRLSLDILFLITDNLALNDKFLLSHTCKALRRVTIQDWDTEILQLTFKDQIGFWVGLAYTLPDYRVCLKCCKLHLINTSDVPAAYWTIKCLRGVPCGIDYSRVIKAGEYSIQHYHVQFALKLSRLGNVHQQYLAALIKTYTIPMTLYRWPLAKSYTAEPRIINKRFILREEWNISDSSSIDLPLFSGASCIYHPICPHMRMMHKELAMSRRWKEFSVHRMIHMSNNNKVTLYEDCIALAYKSPGQWIFNSCMRCPTDFAIMISTDEREATIQAWHDFGIEGSPMDISWKAHVVDETSNRLNMGPYVYYTHGSIRELWSGSISHGTRTGQTKLRSAFRMLIDG
ncbi:hypothetical protein V8C35DRAFT_326472 [Trichoderma chlorosporum]